MPHPPGNPTRSRDGGVMFEIGAGTGALVIRARPEHDGLEIHVSPGKRASHRRHASVRRQRLPDGASYAAVITPLPVGLYTVWDGRTPHGLVAVMDGQVSEYRWA